MVRGPIINHRKKNHMKCLEQVWQYFLTIRASLLFLDGGSSSSPFRLACIDGKTQTPISSFFKSRFKLTSLFNGLWKSSGAKCSEHNEEVFPGTHIFLLSYTKSTYFFRLFFLIEHVAEEWNFMHGYIPIWVLYVATTRWNASLRHYKSRLGKKRCNRPNWYKFLKLRHHTSQILSGRENH